MNKHSEPLFKKVIFHPPGVINFSNFFITPPKTFQLSLGVARKEILTLSALSRFANFCRLATGQYGVAGRVHADELRLTLGLP